MTNGTITTATLSRSIGSTESGILYGSAGAFTDSASPPNLNAAFSIFLSNQSTPSPTNLTATGGLTQVKLAWTGIAGSATYSVSRATTTGTETLLQPGLTTTSFTDTGLTGGTYFYKVTATLSGSESAPSNEATATAQDFTLSANPTAVTIAAGSSATAAITVNPLGGFSGTIFLTGAATLNGTLVGGITAATTANPGAPVFLPISVARSVPPGTYNLTVTGTDPTGTVSHKTAIQVTVTQAQDFTVSASPATLTLAPGGSGGTTVTVTGLSGFTGTVSLSASGQPSGVTPTFAPASVHATGASTLTFTASQSAVPGVYPITVTGTYNSEIQTVSMTLNVTDFSLSASPSLLTVPIGTSKTITLSLTPLFGFTSSAALTVTGMPSGMTAGFSPASVSAGSSSTLTISTNVTVPQNTYNLIISGIANGVTHPTPVTVKVTIPTVAVSIADLSDVYVGYPVTSAATASVNPLPGGYSASQLVATWSYSTVYLVYSATGNDETWTAPGDGSTAGVTLNGAATDPTGTFTGTFNTEGYYEVCIAATVSYHNPTTGENFGPYTGYAFVSNNPPSSTATPSSAGIHPNMPGGAPPAAGRKVYAKALAPTIAIDEQNDPHSPGGLVVPNRDGNGALRQLITVDVSNAPRGWKSGAGNAVVVSWPNASVNLYTSSSSGQPLTSGSTFSASSLPVQLYVAGITPSTSMCDVVITAQATTQGSTVHGQGYANFTVLWMDNINVRLNADGNGSGFLSEDPAAYQFRLQYGGTQIGGPQILGLGTSKHFGWAYESVGAVHPSNFDYPYTGTGSTQGAATNDQDYNRLHIARDVQARFYDNSSVLGADADNKDWNSNPPYANDTDIAIFQSHQPSATGKMYAIDAPQLPPATAWSNNEIKRLRFNGREYGEILAQKKLTRCSLITGFWIRLSAKYTNGSFQATNDQPNDNRAGYGITSITADGLSPAPTGLNAVASLGLRRIYLTWLPSATATSYNVYQSVLPGSGTVNGFYSTTSTNYMLLNVSPGINYAFEVAGVNQYGTGAKSGEVDIVP